MYDWTSRRIEELVASISSGGTPRAGDLRYYAESGTPFLKIDDVTRLSGRFVFEAEQSITEAALNETAAKIHPAGTVLVTMYGTIGVVKTLRIPMATNQAILALVPPFDCNSDYLAHALSFYSADLKRLAAQTTQPNISAKIIRTFEIPVPPHEEQRLIAEILDAIDETIHATENTIAKLQALRKGFLQVKLSALLDYPLASVEHFGIEVTVGIVVRPTQYYASEGIPVLRSANVREGELDMANLVYMSPESHKLMTKTALASGDLLTVRTGYPGTTAVVPRTVQEANCVDLVITRPAGVIDPEFLSLWINSEFGKDHILARQGGLAQQHFNVSDMKALPVPAVESSVQQELVEGDGAFRSRLDAERTELRKLRMMRIGLAADLLSGRVRTVAA